MNFIIEFGLAWWLFVVWRRAAAYGGHLIRLDVRLTNLEARVTNLEARVTEIEKARTPVH